MVLHGLLTSALTGRPERICGAARGDTGECTVPAIHLTNGMATEVRNSGSLWGVNLAILGDFQETRENL